MDVVGNWGEFIGAHVMNLGDTMTMSGVRNLLSPVRTGPGRSPE